MSTTTTTSSSKTSPDARTTPLDAAYYQQLMNEILSFPNTTAAKNTFKQSYQSLPAKDQFNLFFRDILSNLTSSKELGLLRGEVETMRKNLVKLQDAATAEGNTDQKKVGAPKQNQADVPQQSRAAIVCKSEPYTPTKSQNEPKKVVTSRGRASRVDYENQGEEDEAPRTPGAPPGGSRQVKRSELKSDEVKSYVVNESSDTPDDDALGTARNIKKENIEHDDENNLNKLNVNYVKAAAEGNDKKKAHGKQQQLFEEETSVYLKHIRCEQGEKDSKMKRVTSSRKRKSDESDTEDEACADNSSNKRGRTSVVRVARVLRRKTSPSSSSDDSPSSPSSTAVRRRREDAARWEPTRSHPTPDYIEKHKAIRILTNLTNDIREMIKEGATYYEIEKKLAVDFDRKSVGIRNRHRHRYGKDFVEHEYFSRPSGARNDLRQKIATNKPSRREDPEQAERPSYGHWPAYYNSRGHSNNSNSRLSDSSSNSKHGYHRNLWNTKTSSSRIHHYSE